MNALALKLNLQPVDQETKIGQLTTIVESSLKDFLSYVRSNNWWGRENEAVSLYTMGFLIPYCHPQNSVLTSPTQICIEGPPAFLKSRHR